MKITFSENEGCFGFELTAETLADAALLARAAMNTKGICTQFSKSGEITGWLTLTKPRESRRQETLHRSNLNKKA